MLERVLVATVASVAMIVIFASISLFVVGIPAALMKRLAGFLFARQNNPIVGRSIRWGILVGIATISLQVAVTWIPGLRNSGAGWLLTGSGFALLTSLALAVDYWMVVRPMQPRLSPQRTVGFLVLSNVWVLEGAVLLLMFNASWVFPDCYGTDGQRVDTFSQPRPADCWVD
jgi:hypothetical protein